MGIRQGAMEGLVTGKLPDRAFWRGKRVFLTGHTGFKGAWLALWLQRLGAEVTGFALAPLSPSLCEAAGIERLVTSVRGDICDRPALDTAMAEASPEIVIHMAAQALVRRSYEDPIETVATNVLGTAHVLEAARQAGGVQAIVCVTTDKCYENREWDWAYREDDALGGHDPYSASKACAEIMTSAWRRSFFGAGHPIAAATARAGNVIGGGDWASDRLIPDCIRAFSRGETVSIRNPRSTRPWQHVLEPLCGYLLLAEQLSVSGEAFARAWNFGPVLEDVQPVASVVEELARAWGAGAKWQLAGSEHPHEAHFLAVDPSLARSRLGWRPRLRLAEALQWTGAWYSNHSRGRDAAGLMADDIGNYEAIGRG